MRGLTPEERKKFSDVIKGCIQLMVAHQDEVKITDEQHIDTRVTYFTVHVHPDDLGKVIGKKGETAEAVRTIVRNAAKEHSTQTRLLIRDPAK